MKHLVYQTKGTCSRLIDLTVDDDNVIQSVSFVGGCNGNLKGISQLVKGMKADDVIARLKGTQCGSKGTSCPDQLCCALEEIKKA
ncbi:MAG: TIGR03905 family TSCPD domain-containing protein [Prevotella sp.]|nr:TIGR03905 family TSCPD domain-containing protein [Prevotella sp.]MDD7046483.1 TIGR03905 family TSCPD domain-containing protein [Prevotella sp.]MDY5547340.1 TIGR03905 family TSCPD domain-containing protein [Prevotella sp.]